MSRPILKLIDAIAIINENLEIRMHLRKVLQGLKDSDISDGTKDRMRKEYSQQIEEKFAACERAILDVVAFPPQYYQHEKLLKEFWKKGDYEESVFVMTKFPDVDDATNSRKDESGQLTKALRIVNKTVIKCGYKPRLANTQYHANVWDNVVIYMLGCKRGIAIVEELFHGVVNPNVAMEWGWMRCMDKPVLFLREEEATKTTADIEGLIYSKFDLKNPKPGIQNAIEKWLPKRPNSG